MRVAADSISMYHTTWYIEIVVLRTLNVLLIGDFILIFFFCYASDTVSLIVIGTRDFFKTQSCFPPDEHDTRRENDL